MEDARYEKSAKAIKQALLRLLAGKRLEDVSMSELARAAGVSRSTLYAHYGNVQDVYAALVAEFLGGLRSLESHLHCGDCARSGSRPFCVALREAGVYAPVVRDERFLPMLFALVEQGSFASGTANMFSGLGVSRMQAEALYRFQMSGCYAVALADVSAGEWDVIQRTLDAFIRGGINAVKVRLPDGAASDQS